MIFLVYIHSDLHAKQKMSIKHNCPLRFSITMTTYKRYDFLQLKVIVKTKLNWRMGLEMFVPTLCIFMNHLLLYGYYISHIRKTIKTCKGPYLDIFSGHIVQFQEWINTKELEVNYIPFIYYAKLSFLFSWIIAIIKIPFTKKLAKKYLRSKV